jgi:hypothetical protein
VFGCILGDFFTESSGHPGVWLHFRRFFLRIIWSPWCPVSQPVRVTKDFVKDRKTQKCSLYPTIAIDTVAPSPRKREKSSEIEIGRENHWNLSNRTSTFALFLQIFLWKEHLVKNWLISTLDNFSGAYKTYLNFAKYLGWRSAEKIVSLFTNMILLVWPIGISKDTV